MSENNKMNCVRINMTCDKCGFKWYMGFSRLPQKNINASVATCICPNCDEKVLICPQNAILSHPN